jgi:hypothetical protein
VRDGKRESLKRKAIQKTISIKKYEDLTAAGDSRWYLSSANAIERKRLFKNSVANRAVLRLILMVLAPPLPCSLDLLALLLSRLLFLRRSCSSSFELWLVGPALWFGVFLNRLSLLFLVFLQSAKRKCLVIVDSCGAIFRCHHGFKQNRLTRTSDNQDITGLHGFGTSWSVVIHLPPSFSRHHSPFSSGSYLLKLITDHNPTHLVAALDAGGRFVLHFLCRCFSFRQLFQLM